MFSIASTPRSMVYIPGSLAASITESTLPSKGSRHLEPSAILREHRDDRSLLESFSLGKFLNFLLEQTKLKEVPLTTPRYGDIETRYIWEEPQICVVGSSLKPNSYLTCSRALFWWELTDQIPKKVFVGYDLSAKPQNNELKNEPA
jgi:hypothetical protein